MQHAPLPLTPVQRNKEALATSEPAPADTSTHALSAIDQLSRRMQDYEAIVAEQKQQIAAAAKRLQRTEEQLAACQVRMHCIGNVN